MAEPLYDLLRPHLSSSSTTSTTTTTTAAASASAATTTFPPGGAEPISRYLTRLASLRLDDLTTTEPQSLAQANQSNLVSIQALSARSHRTTTISSDHLSSLRTSLPALFSSVEAIRESIPALDAKAVAFASSYNRSKDESITSTSTSGNSNGNGIALLNTRRESALLARQADKVQDILELPSLLAAAIASASSSSTSSSGTTAATGTGSSVSGANYSQALDLFAHIKRLQILYPDSQLVKSVLVDAEAAMKDMTANLIVGLRGQNIRLAAAIRMIGWLRRVAPELASTSATSTYTNTGSSIAAAATSQSLGLSSQSHSRSQIDSLNEGHFGALFLCARLCTFLYMTEALSPLRDLADQETRMRKLSEKSESESDANNGPAHNQNRGKSAPSSASPSGSSSRPETARNPSTSRTRTTTGTGTGTGTGYSGLHGQHTERYLKRYIEIFREQSFATISMYRNIFPQDDGESEAAAPSLRLQSQAQSSGLSALSFSLSLPPALQSFPLHLVEVFMSTLKQYLPNVTEPTARESLLMQVLYAANSLGRLGADFSLMIALFEDESDESDYDYEDEDEVVEANTKENDGHVTAHTHMNLEMATTAPASASAEKEKEEDGAKLESQIHAHTQRDESKTVMSPYEAESELHNEKEKKEEEEDDDEESTTKAMPGMSKIGIESEPEPEPQPQPKTQPQAQPEPQPEPEWVSIIKKHRIQAARLEALAAGQDRLVHVNVDVPRRDSTDIAVR